MIKVLVSGVSGRMGSASKAAIEADTRLEYLGGVSEGECLADAIVRLRPQVVVDFTVADVAIANAMTIIEAGVCPVIGTSGFQEADVAALQEECSKRELGGLIAPNFAIGAVLMMRFAAEAAGFFSRAEIIEAHHDQKKDAPSGTAIKTAEMIAAKRDERPLPLEETELLAGARGANLGGCPIHSIRVPGIVAEQTVLFGGPGQTLRIEHRSIDRESFMPGVVLACVKVPQLKRLVYGLEHLL